MRTTTAAVCVTVVIIAGLCGAADEVTCVDENAGEWFAFTPARDTYGPAMLDLRSLNEPVAGSRGRIVARGGDLVFKETGEQARFWGVVTESWSWPTAKADIDYLSRRLAKTGVNLVRIHIPRGETPPVEFMDTVHYTVHSLKQQGIYSYLVWYCTANQGSLTNLMYFDPQAQEQYKSWARALLGAPDPYTGITLAKDLAVAAVELLDEDSLLFWTFNPERDGLKEKMPILQERFGDWLKTKYGSLRQAAGAWGPQSYPPGDDFAAGRVAMYSAGTLGGADWAVAQRNEKRAADQAQFMTELMRNWYAATKAWLRDDLGYDGMVVGSNWITADERVLGPLDQYANLAADITARNTYFGGNTSGSGAIFAVAAGQIYKDVSLLKEPQQAILMQVQCADHPHMMTEGGWQMPNRFRTEGPFLIACYYSLQGIDGYCPFRIQRDWLGTLEKWPIHTPAGIGQYPAAAIVYRRGYVKQGPVIMNEALDLNDLYALKGAAISQPLGLDAIQAARVPEVGLAQVESLPGVDPLSFFVGRVQREIGKEPGRSSLLNTGKFIDRDAGVVRSATGELALDYVRGLATMDTPFAQGATGFLGAAGRIEFANVTVELDNEYGAVMVVSLDGRPLGESGRILLQVMTEEKNAGWTTEQVTAKLGEGLPDGPALRIVSTGTALLQVRKVAGRVWLKRPDEPTPKVTALDANGYAREKLSATVKPIRLVPDCLHYIIEY